MQDVDRRQHEPMDEEEIDFVVSFSSAFLEQADGNGHLFEVATEWSQERVMAYQQAFFIMNVAVNNPEIIGEQE
ncbi:hypothetical protein UFOVP621_89 [uncultured Caudovirales phage]|uniref:Uncharacterized protein n=1 Tax=uncultured Caudovirales phage TaxID=2100421 RepID=A0A6J5N7Y6_9CAUD|nr:hypothetical protein UFOVP621_89 [uncultured Caudovirales phage]